MFRKRSLVAALTGAAVTTAISVSAAVAPSASASGSVEIVKNNSTDYFVACNANSDYGASSYRPITLVYNVGCGERVWLHQYYYGYHNWGGWTYCVSPYSSASISGKYEDSADVYVSSNSSSC